MVAGRPRVRGTAAEAGRGHPPARRRGQDAPALGGQQRGGGGQWIERLLSLFGRKVNTLNLFYKAHREMLH